MKLKCDLCSGELEVNTAGTEAVCRCCGLAYGADRLREKRNEMRPPVVRTPEVSVSPAKEFAVSDQDRKKMKVMWILWAIIGLVAFFGTLFAGDARQEAIVVIVCFVALMITLIIFKPWKVYGGKAI